MTRLSFRNSDGLDALIMTAPVFPALVAAKSVLDYISEVSSDRVAGVAVGATAFAIYAGLMFGGLYCRYNLQKRSRAAQMASR